MKRSSAFVALLLATSAVAAWAIEGWDLTASDVRQAYFLGQRRSDQRLAEFLADYVKRLPAPASGPHVAVIQLSTPYHQVVKRSWRMPVGYSSQQAQQDYRANPHLVLVNVTVNLVPGDVATMRELGFWKEFHVRLLQDGRMIFPHRFDGELIYSGDDAFRSVIGFELRAEFSTHQLARAPAHVEVITHEQTTVTTQFDLARLK